MHTPQVLHTEGSGAGWMFIVAVFYASLTLTLGSALLLA